MSQAGPTGSVIDVHGRITHCVGREDYHNVPPFLKAGPAGLGKAACDYILGGKLVCLADADECAFGHIISIEPVGSGKSGFDQIDNDFCFNVLLSPWVVSDFSASLSRDANLIRVATDGMQGRLLVDPKKDTNPLPQPDSPAASSPALEAALGKNMTGIAITYLFGDGQPHPYDDGSLPLRWILRL